jgi:hypothetical protein
MLKTLIIATVLLPSSPSRSNPSNYRNRQRARALEPSNQMSRTFS